MPAWLASWPMARIVIAAVSLIGVAVLLYPMAGSWFAARHDGQTITGYAQMIASKPSEQVTQERQAAVEYNEALPVGRPPLSLATLASTLGADEVSAYNHLLDDGPNGLMAVLTIPALKLSLPVFHGTGPTALELGVGHIEGTSLPIGGPGTHAVLSGHSGIIGKDLFSRLDQVALGDTFTITILDEALTYKVDHIDVVTPTETSELQITPQEDYVTLVTCTPVGINSHRLLVRGVRVQEPDSTSPMQVLRSAYGAGFPWWTLLGLGAIVVTVVATSPLADRRTAPVSRPTPRPTRRRHPKVDPPRTTTPLSTPTAAVVRPQVGTHRRPRKRDPRPPGRPAYAPAE